MIRGAAVKISSLLFTHKYLSFLFKFLPADYYFASGHLRHNALFNGTSCNVEQKYHLVVYAVYNQLFTWQQTYIDNIWEMFKMYFR